MSESSKALARRAALSGALLLFALLLLRPLLIWMLIALALWWIWMSIRR